MRFRASIVAHYKFEKVNTTVEIPEYGPKTTRPIIHGQPLNVNVMIYASGPIRLRAGD